MDTFNSFIRPFFIVFLLLLSTCLPTFTSDEDDRYLDDESLITEHNQIQQFATPTEKIEHYFRDITIEEPIPPTPKKIGVGIFSTLFNLVPQEIIMPLGAVGVRTVLSYFGVEVPDNNTAFLISMGIVPLAAGARATYNYIMNAHLPLCCNASSDSEHEVTEYLEQDSSKCSQLLHFYFHGVPTKAVQFFLWNGIATLTFFHIEGKLPESWGDHRIWASVFSGFSAFLSYFIIIKPTDNLHESSLPWKDGPACVTIKKIRDTQAYTNIYGNKEDKLDSLGHHLNVLKSNVLLNVNDDRTPLTRVLCEVNDISNGLHPRVKKWNRFAERASKWISWSTTQLGSLPTRVLLTYAIPYAMLTGSGASPETAKYISLTTSIITGLFVPATATKETALVSSWFRDLIKPGGCHTGSGHPIVQHGLSIGGSVLGFIYSFPFFLMTRDLLEGTGIPPAAAIPLTSCFYTVPLAVVSQFFSKNMTELTNWVITRCDSKGEEAWLVSERLAKLLQKGEKVSKSYAPYFTENN